MTTQISKIKKQAQNQQWPYDNKIVTNNKKCKKYFMIDPQTKVYFNGDFDSGNLENVQQLSPYVYKLYPGYDKVKMTTQKTYFHFKVYGFHMCMVRFHIVRVGILEKLLKKGQEKDYRPIVKKGKNSQYQPIQKGVSINYNKQDEAQLIIQYEFGQEQDWAEFSFSYPYSYQDSTNLIKELRIKYIDHSDIYFHDEVLCYTQEGRKLEMITVTEKINCKKDREQQVQGLFPQCQDNQGKISQVKRPFKISKPKIIISGRVHPGQTPASYCVEGLLRFLLDEKDYRAYLLRKNFHFIIVPMLSPDGVYHGMFRSDLNGENLNRLYLKCSKKKHPTIFAFREYLKYVQLSQQPVMFYFDFHAHPSKKQFFIYGNAFNEFTHQVQAETFGKLLQNNCPYFHNIDSIFSQKQMVSKDKHDQHTKQGCGRVFNHKLFNIIHSYTVQCGYFAPQKIQKCQQSQQITKRISQICTDEYLYVPTWQKYDTSSYTPQSYMLMGKSILVAVLDLFHMNPYTRINISQFKSISNIRKNVGAKIYNLVERFRLIDSIATKKLRDLTKIMEQSYYKVKVGTYSLSISENYGMRYPKKTYSLQSRVYQSKKQIQSKNKEKEREKQKNKQKTQGIQNQKNLFLQQQRYNENQQPFADQSQSSQVQQQQQEGYYSLTKFDKNLLNQAKQQTQNQNYSFKQIKSHIETKIKLHNLKSDKKLIQNQKQLLHQSQNPHQYFLYQDQNDKMHSQLRSINLQPHKKLNKYHQIQQNIINNQSNFLSKKQLVRLSIAKKVKQIIVNKQSQQGDAKSPVKISSQTNLRIINKYSNSINAKDNLNKSQSKNRLTNMIQSIQQKLSASVSIKSQRSESRMDSINQQKSKKQSKIDMFIKKQQMVSIGTKNKKDQKISQLEKYVTENIKKQNLKNLSVDNRNKIKLLQNTHDTTSISKLPALNTKYVGNKQENTWSKSLKIKNL